MEATKFVLSVIGILFGLKWVSGGVSLRTSPGWDMSKNPPEFCPNGMPVGSNVVAFQFTFVVLGIVVLYFSIMNLWNFMQPLL